MIRCFLLPPELHAIGVQNMDKLLPTVKKDVELEKLHKMGKKAKRGRKKKS